MRVGELYADTYEHDYCDDYCLRTYTRYRVYQVTGLTDKGHTSQYAGYEFRDMADAQRKADELNANG